MKTKTLGDAARITHGSGPSLLGGQLPWGAAWHPLDVELSYRGCVAGLASSRRDLEAKAPHSWAVGAPRGLWALQPWAVGHGAFTESGAGQRGPGKAAKYSKLQAGSKTSVSWKGQVLRRTLSLWEEGTRQALGEWVWGWYRPLPSPGSGVWTPALIKPHKKDVRALQLPFQWPVTP